MFSKDDIDRRIGEIANSFLIFDKNNNFDHGILDFFKKIHLFSYVMVSTGVCEVMWSTCEAYISHIELAIDYIANSGGDINSEHILNKFHPALDIAERIATKVNSNDISLHEKDKTAFLQHFDMISLSFKELRKKFKTSRIGFIAELKIKELLRHVENSKIEAEKSVFDIVNRAEPMVVERVDRALASAFGAIDDEIKRNKEKLNSIVDETKSDLSDMVKLSKEKIDIYAEHVKEKTDKITQGSSEAFSDIQAKLKEASDIVEIISSSAQTNHFRGAADRDRDAADILRWISFALMLCSAAWSIGLAVVHMCNGWNVAWHEILFRWSGGILLLIPAGYFMSESARHRYISNKNRRIELDLASVESYIQNLTDEQRRNVKIEMMNRIFGQHESNNEVIQKASCDIASNILGLLGKCIEKEKK